jgi:hypothetical protein
MPSPKKNKLKKLNLHPIKMKSVSSLILNVLIQGCGIIAPSTPPKIGLFSQ